MEEAKQDREKGEPKIRRRIFRELEAIAFQDPKEYVKTEEIDGELRQVPRAVSEMKPRARRVIEAVNFQKDGGVTYKMYSKLKALEILGRMEGQPIPGEEGAGLSEGDRMLLEKAMKRHEGNS